MDWGTLILAVLGGGGFVAVVNVIANKNKTAAESKKIQADVVATLAGYYSEELETMRAEIKSLQGGRKTDEVTIDDLKKAVKQRDKRISELEKQVKEIVSEKDKQVGERDNRITGLESQVAEMRKQIDELTKGLCP